MSCPSHSSQFITRTILGQQYRPLISTLRSFLRSSVTSPLLGPNTLLNTLFSNTLRLRSSLNVSDQVSRPYKTTGKNIFHYMLVFKFLDSKLEDKTFRCDIPVVFYKLNTKYNYQSKHNKKLLYYVLQYVLQLHVSAIAAIIRLYIA